MAYAKINGIDLYYEVHGEGHPLVLSHGIGSNHLHWWQQIPVLSKRFQVISFDHRGFGFSKDINGMGPAAFIDDLEGLLLHLGVEKAALCGQSMGGFTVGGYASRNPENVSALILSSSGGGFFPMPHSQAYREAVAKVKTYAEFATLAIEQDGFPQRHPQLRFLYESLGTFNSHFDITRRADLGKMKFDLQPLIDARIPVLLIGGEDDNGANAALGQIKEAVPNAQFDVVDNAGHLLFFEAPETYNRLVLDFLNAHHP